MDFLTILNKSWEILSVSFLNQELFFILLPIYANWILSEIFFEHRLEEFGTYFSNGFAMLWILMFYGKYLALNFSLSVGWVSKLILFGFLCFIAAFLMVNALKGKKIVKYVGKTREVSFLIIFATPIFYGVLNFDLTYFIACIFLFLIIETILYLLHKLIPQFKGEKLDIESKES